MTIVAQTIVTTPQLEKLSPAWRDLWRRVPSATVFQSPDWLIPWWRHFVPGRLTCIALWHDDMLVGCAPLYREEASGRVLPLGISLSDYLDVLVAPEIADAVSRALQAAIARVCAGTEICFPDVAPDAALLSLDPAGFAASRGPGQVCPQLPLGAPENPLCHVPARQRQKLRMARNRAGRRGCVLSDVAPGDLGDFVPVLMQLHSARQQQLGRPGLGQDARVLAFFSEAFASLADQGVLRAYSVECEGRMVGGYVGFLHGGRAMSYFGGFDPQFAFESPGTILLGHAMECAAAEGAFSLDFLRGAESYKYLWGARDRQLLSVSFTHQRRDVELAS